MVRIFRFGTGTGNFEYFRQTDKLGMFAVGPADIIPLTVRSLKSEVPLQKEAKRKLGPAKLFSLP